MTLQLILDNKTHIYTNKFISGMIFRRALHIEKMLQDKGLTIPIMDDMLRFVCDVFDNEFSVTELYNGLERHEVSTVCINVIERVINGEYSYTQRCILWS